MRRRIVWNEDEIDSVFSEVRKLWPKSTRINLDAICKAQQVLTADRQRVFYPSTVLDFNHRYQIWLQSQEPLVVAEPVENKIEAEITRLKLENYRLKQDMRHVTAVVELILSRLSRDDSKVAEYTPSLMPRKRLPRVLVVGLLPQQQNAVNSAFGGLVEITHIPSDVDVTDSMLRNRAHVDVVYQMVRFTSHAATAACQRVFPKSLRLCPGSVSSLSAMIYSFLESYGEQA